MLLERLLTGLEVRVDSVGVCRVSPGWRLCLPGPGTGAIVHFALTGSTQLLAPGDTKGQELEPCTMVIVPAGVDHCLQCGSPVREEQRIVPNAEGGVDPRDLVAGEGDSGAATVACGHLMAGYADSMDLFRGLRVPLVVDLSDSDQAEGVFEEMIEQQAGHRPGYQPLVNSLMFQGLVMFFRRLCDGEDCPLPWLDALEDARLARVLDHILDHPGHRHTVESLADVAGMSRSAFAETFSRSFGDSPKSFVTSVRMHEAARLLRYTDLSVRQISSRLGYASRSHFSRLFTSRVGVSPRQLRRT